MKQWKWAVVAASCAVVLAGCGGASDGSNTTPKSVVSSVKVFGDSVMDSGTFGYKFTIQSSDAANPFLIAPEIVAANFGVGPLCPFFNNSTFDSATFTQKASCTNFAVAGAHINNATNTTNPGNTNAYSIPYQLGVGSTTLVPTDMVIVDGGGNDLSQLIGAYLLAGTSQAAAGAFIGLVGTVVPAATLGGILGTTPTQQSMGLAAGAYAYGVGTILATSVKTYVVAKGVSKVVVINAPDVTLVPEFNAILAGVAAQAGTAQRDAVQAAARAWTQALNKGIADGLAGTNVQIYDLYTEGARIFATPAQFGLTNVTKASCPTVAGGVSTTTGVPQLTFPVTVAACTSANMSAKIPAGETSANWWQSYAYADYLHPSPALHKLIGQSINLQLAKAGWL